MVCGGAAVYTPEKIRELIRTAVALQEEAKSGFGIGALMNTRRRDVEISATLRKAFRVVIA